MPGKPQRLHRRHLVRRHLALDPGEEPPLPELLLQLRAIEPQHARQPPGRVARVGELARVAVDRIDVGGRRQLGAVAVEDPAAPRRQLDLAQVLLLGHRAQPVRLAHLQLERALADRRRTASPARRRRRRCGPASTALSTSAQLRSLARPAGGGADAVGRRQRGPVLQPNDVLGRGRPHAPACRARCR